MRWLLPVAAAASLLACGDNTSSDPFDSLPLDGEFTVGLTAPVHVARDKYGVAHIDAQNVSDAGFVQGYIMAHDRLPQMDILRRYGAGTLAELFGGADPSVIDTDLAMRVHRMKPLAQQSWETLKASTSPTDKKIVAMLQRFSDGVNQYAADLKAGMWDLDPNVAVSFDPARFADWSPVDSLVLGRFQAFSLSFSASFETDATELYQKLAATFDGASSTNPAAYARRGVSHDILRFTPVGLDPTIDGFPNDPTDTGTRSDGSGTGTSPRNVSLAPGQPGVRPTIPQDLFDAARKFFPRDVHDGPLGALGPHAFMRPWAGSNNWAVGPTFAGPNTALLATDQHLQLPNPSIFYPTHLIIHDETDPVDVLGITFPGIPGVILGSNGHLAWAATVSEHDVNDVFYETIAPCAGGTGDCAQTGPVEKVTEHFVVGVLGTKTDEFDAVYEYTPHGPLIPQIGGNHRLVPRATNHALAIQYTGYEPTYEIKALFELDRAKNVAEGFQALADFSYGSQNWTMIDDTASFAWTTNAKVPNRPAAAYTWNANTNPTGNAPFFILPGDGTADWNGYVSPRYVPHAINPSQGYLATANADPVGATFDDDPLNQTDADGKPLYVGITYDAGLREERITKLLKDKHAGGNLTLDDMRDIQADTNSNMGEHLRAPIVAALGALDSTAGMPSDVAPYLQGLSSADKARLQAARTLFQNWNFSTPVAPDGNSAATCLFNGWMHYFISRTLDDEMAAIDFDTYRMDDGQIVRIIDAMLNAPTSFVVSPATQQPILCDDYASATTDSCTKAVLQSALDAMKHFESADGFGTADTSMWAWGKLHKLTLTPLFPNSALNLPPPGEAANPGGFSKPGDNFNINRSDEGYADLDFNQFADGPAQRFLAITTPDHPQIQVKWALPGGVIYDSRSPHYRDLLDNYYLPVKHFDAPYTVEEINANGESRQEWK